MNRIYMDVNASTAPAPGVPEAIARAFSESWGNPSSSHAEGRRARACCEAARLRVAEAVGADPEEVVFTSGGSESDALAIRGLVEAGVVGGLVIGSLEHPAVIESALWLSRTRGTPLRVVEASKHATIDPEALAAAAAEIDRPLVSIMNAQNEIGVCNDIAALKQRVARHDLLFHSDAVAAFGKIPLAFGEWGLDLMTVSAHKIGGPPGVGALIVRRELQPAAFCRGGTQEQGKRRGTEPLPSIAGFGAAAAQLPTRLELAAQVGARRDWFEKLLQERVPDLMIAGGSSPRLPNTSAILFRGLRGTDIVAACDAHGLAVSAGAACHSAEGSPVMRSLGCGPEWARGLVRVSMSPTVTELEVETAAAILSEVVSLLRGRH